ncbi:calcitonin receptor-like isoform X2 [Macrobrachium nipponense]
MPLPDPDFGPYCPRTFDGWSCWNDTPAGHTAYVPCPEFVTGFDPKRFGHKDCDENGMWFTHPTTNQTWSNYTTCIDFPNLQLHQGINMIYIAGYSMSLIALCISLFIFCFFKSLKCKRVTIHKNLFVSFIINNALWLLWYECVVGKPDVLFSNGVLCQVLHVFLHYFLVSNYFWMFCEGLYLHTLLVVAFVSEDRIMKWFYLLGWGFPGLLDHHLRRSQRIRRGAESALLDGRQQVQLHPQHSSGVVHAAQPLLPHQHRESPGHQAESCPHHPRHSLHQKGCSSDVNPDSFAGTPLHPDPLPAFARVTWRGSVPHHLCHCRFFPGPECVAALLLLQWRGPWHLQEEVEPAQTDEGSSVLRCNHFLVHEVQHGRWKYHGDKLRNYHRG